MKRLALLAPLLVACGNTPPPREPAQSPPVAPTARAPDNTPKRASPNVSVAADIAALCHLELAAPSNEPKFDYDSADLLPEDTRLLDQIAQCFSTGPLKGRGLQLVGRADPRGTESYNMALGAKRAHQVGDYVERRGVKPQVVSETSRGSIDATGKDEPGWRVDRRVDLLLAP